MSKTKEILSCLLSKLLDNPLTKLELNFMEHSIKLKSIHQLIETQNGTQELKKSNNMDSLMKRRNLPLIPKSDCKSPKIEVKNRLSNIFSLDRKSFEIKLNKSTFFGNRQSNSVKNSNSKIPRVSSKMFNETKREDRKSLVAHTSKSKLLSCDSQKSKVKKNLCINLRKSFSPNRNDKINVIKKATFCVDLKNNYVSNISSESDAQKSISNCNLETNPNSCIKKHIEPKIEIDNNISHILGNIIEGDELINNQFEKFLLNDSEFVYQTHQIDKKKNQSERKTINEIDYRFFNNYSGEISNKEDNSNRNNQEVNVIEFDEIIEDKWSIFSSFFDKKDLFKIMKVNKKYHRLSLTKLISTCKSEKLVYKEKLKNLKNQKDDHHINSNENFMLSKGSLKAIELLNTGSHLKTFNINLIPNEDVLLPFRIYFILMGKKELLNSNNADFWENCCHYFTREELKLGDIIQSSIKFFNFSDENILKISKLVMYKEKIINPNYFSKISATTGLIIFIIKDTLEFMGLLTDKKSDPSKLIKLYSIFNENTNQKLIRILEIQKSHYGGSISDITF